MYSAKLIGPLAAILPANRSVSFWLIALSSSGGCGRIPELPESLADVWLADMAQQFPGGILECPVSFSPRL